MDCTTTTLSALLLHLLLSLVLPQQSCNPDSNIGLDREALLKFKKGISRDPQNVLTNWNEATHVCDWKGVHCNKSISRVTRLRLEDTFLVGKISQFLANISCLQSLHLSQNYFQGPIPEELGALSKLVVLNLEENKIRSVIPDSFGKLSNLHYINLRGNWLNGRLPKPLFYNCTNLELIDLSENFLTGQIPPFLGNFLLDLHVLLLYNNKFTGSIPPSLSNSTKMEIIDLTSNLLSGALPSDIVIHMPNLTDLHISDNNLSSDDNNSNLTPFFRSISNLTSLTILELAGNDLGGELPFMMGQLPCNLSKILLQDNQIHGVIPPSISNLTNLVDLNLSNNLLSGTIPLELILLPHLQRLWVSNNSLHGEIPSPPGVSTKLGLVDLSCNNLSSTIPISLANLTQLRILDLHKNSLSGHIPSSLGSINLEQLDLSQNQLTGVLPAEVVSLNSMQIFNLSFNLLEEALPMELSSMDKVRVIDLSSNNLSGNIPVILENCKEVEVLNLSHNSLQGPLPSSLGSLPDLQSLDLSHNFLSGNIPDSLQKCTSLKLLNLSFNNFSGQIPEGGIFYSLTYDSIKGNHLCGTLSGIPTCQNRQKTHIFIALIFGSTLLSLALLAILYMVCSHSILIKNQLLKRNHQNSTRTSLEFMKSYQRITYRELLEATKGFDQSKIIGSGRFGHVYKGMLSGDSIVAIKVLQFQSSDFTKTFNRECQILKRIRHRNLIRIITTCSLPDFKALVLPFMANGNLESHLHPQGQHSSFKFLSFVERVNICCDVAEAMAYLHHHAPVQVIHCDLKPSNILLNDDMMALVSDFGIARLAKTTMEKTMASEDTTNTELLCGTIGYMAPDLQKWVKNNYCGQLREVIDPFIMHDLKTHKEDTRSMWETRIVQMLDLGLLCAQEVPSTRPTMIDVVDDLEKVKYCLNNDASSSFSSSNGITNHLENCK
ncbi:hypothetical protein J5N97_008197 [Dioscorea zingiberensis]|uniref:Protein kinase domain-containing protein n=1 Tax=Dioscorea zingiberensis TaxID=325984 RepID=A0A9D5DDD9_9LILI|nr:hypothetical protein J5N97_008197 [Dioscorea zingiberensis]